MAGDGKDTAEQLENLCLYLALSCYLGEVQAIKQKVADLAIQIELFLIRRSIFEFFCDDLEQLYNLPQFLMVILGRHHDTFAYGQMELIHAEKVLDRITPIIG